MALHFQRKKFLVRPPPAFNFRCIAVLWVSDRMVFWRSFFCFFLALLFVLLVLPVSVSQDGLPFWLDVDKGCEDTDTDT
jgi:hypothetical protein